MVQKKKSVAKRRSAPKKIDTIEKLAILMVDGFSEVHTEIADFRSDVDARFKKVDQRFAQVDQRFAQVDQRFEQIESRLSNIESELSDIKQRLEWLERVVPEQSGYAKEIDLLMMRVKRLEARLASKK